MIQVLKRKLHDFASESSFRCDYNYLKNLVVEENKEYYSYKKLFEIVAPKSVELSEEVKFKYSEIGNVSRYGEVLPVELSFDNRNPLNESLFKKIEKGDIFLPDKGNIIISSIRPSLNKVVLIEDSDLGCNSPVYFTKAFIQIKPKINSQLLYYLLKTVFHEQIVGVSRQGKGYPTLKENDLKNLKFEKQIIDKIILHQSELIHQIMVIEIAIKELKSQRKDKRKIVDDVFSRHFKIDLEKLNKLEINNKVNVNISKLLVKNPNIRNSYRWNKMKYLQDYLYSNINCIEKLGKYIIKTNNGWSPESIEGGEGIPVLGQEHFNFDGSLRVEPTKATLKEKNNMQDFFIKENNFFVSRGNTVDLVGIASVVEKPITEDIIYPDLYIKIEFTEEINKKYLCLLFNSFFGRIYFKYASKGKNQTMVKISKDELVNFNFPNPTLEIQNTIVKEIEKLISAQNELNSEIENKEMQINALVSNSYNRDN